MCGSCVVVENSAGVVKTAVEYAEEEVSARVVAQEVSVGLGMVVRSR